MHNYLFIVICLYLYPQPLFVTLDHLSVQLTSEFLDALGLNNRFWYLYGNALKWKRKFCENFIFKKFKMRCSSQFFFTLYGKTTSNSKFLYNIAVIANHNCSCPYTYIFGIFFYTISVLPFVLSLLVSYYRDNRYHWETKKRQHG